MWGAVAPQLNYTSVNFLTDVSLAYFFHTVGRFSFHHASDGALIRTVYDHVAQPLATDAARSSSRSLVAVLI